MGRITYSHCATAKIDMKKDVSGGGVGGTLMSERCALVDRKFAYAVGGGITNSMFKLKNVE